MNQATFLLPKKLFKNVSLLLSAFVLSFIIQSCSKSGTTTEPSITTEEATATAKGKPNTLSEVLLKLTVNGAGNNVTSDGNNDYINGVQNVSARIDQYGNLIFSCGSSGHGPSATPDRWLNYNFSSPLTGSSVRNNEKGAYIATIKSSIVPTTFIPLQELTVGSTECITMAMGLFTLENGVVNFHRQPTEDNNSTPTAYVYVTRNSDIQWTMTPVPPLSGGCSTISNVAALRVSTELVGYYNMPFSLTLTKL